MIDSSFAVIKCLYKQLISSLTLRWSYGLYKNFASMFTVPCLLVDKLFVDILKFLHSSIDVLKRPQYDLRV